MPKKVCPNGHIYDSSIYGEECPLCPKGESAGYNAQPAYGGQEGAGTRVTPPMGGGAAAGPAVPPIPQDAAGETQLHGMGAAQAAPAAGGYNAAPAAGAAPVGGGTVIRQPKGVAAPGKGRKLVGFLVTYNRNPQGKAYELYEGKNYVGRDRSCDICVPDDNQMSGRHMSILYRNVDNKFKYRDEQSSNGSFVNKELSDEGELQNFDIIRLGSTIFIFIAIPQLG